MRGVRNRGSVVVLDVVSSQWLFFRVHDYKLSRIIVVSSESNDEISSVNIKSSWEHRSILNFDFVSEIRTSLDDFVLNESRG